MRRGPYLFPLLVLPFASIFALDSSKSQPAHFIIVMSIAILLSVIFVSISRAGIDAQIKNLRGTTLTITAQHLLWSSAIGQSELAMESISGLAVHHRRAHVRSIVLKLANRSTMRIEGYERMDELYRRLDGCLQRGGER